MTAHPALPLVWQTLAWCHLEEMRGTPLRDAEIEAAAVAAGPDLCSRIAARAAALSAREGLDTELHALARRGRQALVLVLCVGGLVGLGAAGIVPAAAPARVNVMDMLGALLAPNLFTLLVWAVLQAAASARCSGAVGSPLGHTLLLLAQRFARVGPARSDQYRRAARSAWVEYHLGTAGGRARLAVVSQVFWLALALGATLGCWWLLSLREVDFYWGSTLLGPEGVGRAIDALGRPIAALGIPVPDAADVAASRLGAAVPDPELRARWGWFLLGALLVYGVAPRILALALCVALIRRGDRRCDLDLSRPGYLRLRSFLQTEAPRSRIRDPDDSVPRGRPADSPGGDRAEPPRGAAWLALERALSAPDDAVNLGTVVDREDQRRVLTALTAASAWPALVVHAPLAAIPDRGVAQFVAALVGAARVPIWLRIAAEDEHGLSDVDSALRVEDWRALALTAGIPAARIAEGSK